MTKMAALIGHGTLGYSLFAKNALIAVVTTQSARHYAQKKFKFRLRKVKKGPPPPMVAKWEWNEKSLASRGFLRSVKPYKPTGDVSTRLNDICHDEGISSENSTVIDNLEDRYKLFVACEKEFNYSIPNSQLHTILTIENLRDFYMTPVNTTMPLDGTKKMDLPKNLHIMYEYNRFHPDTDTKFGGKTAFPKSSTLVTGLKARKKYPSLIQDNPFKSDYV